MSEETKSKVSWVGAPAIFKLELACQHITAAFAEYDGYGCYRVGSSNERQDWRDVDVRLILPDQQFAGLFPAARLESAAWEFDPLWLLLNISIAGWLKEQTGLPIDFQIQPQTFANKHHRKRRDAMGLRLSKPEGESA